MAISKTNKSLLIPMFKFQKHLKLIGSPILKYVSIQI